MFTFIDILSISVFTLQWWNWVVATDTWCSHCCPLLTHYSGAVITWQHFDCHAYPIIWFYFTAISAYSSNQNKKRKRKDDFQNWIFSEQGKLCSVTVIKYKLTLDISFSIELIIFSEFKLKFWGKIELTCET